jgi:hypothetical protein
MRCHLANHHLSSTDSFPRTLNVLDSLQPFKAKKEQELAQHVVFSLLKHDGPTQTKIYC